MERLRFDVWMLRRKEVKKKSNLNLLSFDSFSSDSYVHTIYHLMSGQIKLSEGGDMCVCLV